RTCLHSPPSREDLTSTIAPPRGCCPATGSSERGTPSEPSCPSSQVSCARDSGSAGRRELTSADALYTRGVQSDGGCTRVPHHDEWGRQAALGEALGERDATIDHLQPLPHSHRSSRSMGSACPAGPRNGVQLAVLESTLLFELLGEPLCDQTHRSTPSGPHPRRQPDRCRAALAGAPGSEATRPRGYDRARGHTYRSGQ